MQLSEEGEAFMSKRMVILGAGESGAGAALLAKQQGYEVFVSDASSLKDNYRNELQHAGVEFEEGMHHEEKILNADEVMKSPGIPEKNEMVKKIRAKGIPVISEVELAWRFKGNSKIVAVTGSNGKTTTTALTYHICKTSGLDCAIVGNIGYSFARQVALDPKPLYVAEISSFQLDDIKDFSKPEYKGSEIIYSNPFYNAKIDKVSTGISNYFATKMYARPSDMVFRGYEVTWKFSKLLWRYGKDLASNLGDKQNKVFTDFDIQPVLSKQNMTLDYFENRKLYFLKWQDGMIKSVY